MNQPKVGDFDITPVGATVFPTKEGHTNYNAIACLHLEADETRARQTGGEDAGNSRADTLRATEQRRTARQTRDGSGHKTNGNTRAMTGGKPKRSGGGGEEQGIGPRAATRITTHFTDSMADGVPDKLICM